MQRISPFLWFNNQAEKAARFYTSIFKKSRITKVTRYTKAGAQAAGPLSLVPSVIPPARTGQLPRARGTRY